MERQEVAFDIAWGIAKDDDEPITCPQCGESGNGTWYLQHFPECAQRFVTENSENIELIPNEKKDAYNRALETLRNLGAETDDLQPLVDSMEDFNTQASGYQGLTPEQSDELLDVQERAMIDNMKATGQIGYHPDPEVRRDNTTWRVGLHFDNDEGLYHMRREFVENAISRGDLNERDFAEQMIDMFNQFNHPVVEELEDNERTWDDVDWESILNDELEAQIDDRYTGLAQGEFDEDDLEIYDILDFVDDDEHQGKVRDAKIKNATEVINRLTHQALREGGVHRDQPRSVDNNYGYDPETGMADSEGYNRIYEEEKRKVIEAMQDEEFRDNQPGLGPTSFDEYMKNYLRQEKTPRWREME